MDSLHRQQLCFLEIEIHSERHEKQSAFTVYGFMDSSLFGFVDLFYEEKHTYIYIHCCLQGPLNIESMLNPPRSKLDFVPF